MSNYCYAGTALDIISEGTYVSPTLIKKQYSKTFLTAVVIDPFGGAAANGHFKFFPEETGEYTVTIELALEDQGGESFNAYILDADNNYIYDSDFVRENS